MVTIRVPASTSNLGPGFDCLGVALRLHNDISIARGEGKALPAIVKKAARLFFRELGTGSFPFQCAVTDKIPRSRGLGSSGTVRAGVLLGLNHLVNEPLDRARIFELAARLEKHPDNVAPAIFGGFTVGGRTVQRVDVSPKLHFVLLVPELEIETSAARKILPNKIVRTAAVQSCRNACAITAAFASQDYARLRGAFEDALHQPFRCSLVPFLPRVVRAAEKAGALGGFLSGSGSTIAAVTLGSPARVGQAMLSTFGSKPAQIIITTADNRGAHVLSIRNPKPKIQNR